MVAGHLLAAAACALLSGSAYAWTARLPLPLSRVAIGGRLPLGSQAPSSLSTPVVVARRRRGLLAVMAGGLDLFEKDCVEFVMPAEMQPLCIREQGSTEWYLDSRVEPLNLAEDAIIRIMDTYPSQRPVPSLGGGIGYGADALDCWELQEELDDKCAIPIEDTGMGFHQKGW